MSDALQAAERMTDGLLHTLRLARAMAGAQRDVTLAGLVDRVGFACAKAMDLPPLEGRQLRPKLTVLLAEVDAVSVALRG